MSWLLNLPGIGLVLRNRDFRLLWLGTFISFTGSQIQNVAQGYYVYELTGDKAKLALVSFCLMVPFTILGPFSGLLSDLVSKKRLMVICMSVMALGTAFLAVAASAGFLQYWHLLLVALVSGVMQTVEAPTRQSMVRYVVGDASLPEAIPAQAMTFNLARVAGPALGGILAANYGPQLCFAINTVSFMALVFAALAIRANLEGDKPVGQTWNDLLLEGMRYTFRMPTLRTLFVMESCTSLLGVWYIAQMPAIARSMFGQNEVGLGTMFTAVGVGAFSSLVTLAILAKFKGRALLLLFAMGGIAVSLLALSLTKSLILAYVCLFFLGFCSVMQFNTTNTLFQLNSPPKLRGRVLSMHFWALSGLAPIGILFFGWFAEQTSLESSLLIGGFLMVLATGWAVTQWKKIPEVTREEGGDGAE